MTQLDERAVSIGDQTITPALRIRPYEGTDVGLVRAMSSRLSRRSLYERFFAGTPSLPPMYLNALAKADHYDREVLLAVIDEPAMAGGEVVVGIAEYIRDREVPELADLAVLVADGWQRRGVGRRLVMRLGMLAASRGLAGFKADALMTNRAALGAIASIWPDARGRRDGTTTSFTLPVHALF